MQLVKVISEYICEKRLVLESTAGERRAALTTWESIVQFSEDPGKTKRPGKGWDMAQK